MIGLYEVQLLTLIPRLLSLNDTTDNKANPSQLSVDYPKLRFTILHIILKKKIFNIKMITTIYTKIDIYLEKRLTTSKCILFTFPEKLFTEDKIVACITIYPTTTPTL